MRVELKQCLNVFIYMYICIYCFILKNFVNTVYTYLNFIKVLRVYLMKAFTNTDSVFRIIVMFRLHVKDKYPILEVWCPTGADLEQI